MKKSSAAKTFLSATAVLLIIASVMCMAASCARQDDTEDTGTEAVTTVDPDAGKYDSQGYLKDSLPEKTNLGETVTILYWSDVENPEFFVEDTNGGKVEEAINRRNAKVEERLGVKLDFIGTPGNASKRADYIAKIRADFSGDRLFDIYAGYTLAMATAATSGFCANLLDHSSIDFTAPWWPEKLISESTINNKLFFATGDLSTNLLYMMYVMYFNKDMMSANSAGSPYDCVDNNTWTYEKMIEMSHAVDGRQTGDDPIYGFVANTMHTDPFFYGAGLRTIDRDADGKPVISDSFNSSYRRIFCRPDMRYRQQVQHAVPERQGNVPYEPCEIRQPRPRRCGFRLRYRSDSEIHRRSGRLFHLPRLPVHILCDLRCRPARGGSRNDA